MRMPGLSKMATWVLMMASQEETSMDEITFLSEWMRVTRVTRSRNYHEQMEEINSISFRLELTVCERSSMVDRATLVGMDMIKNRQLFANRGGHEW